jgi:alcohol dehydrogenase (cytochrome c)
MVAAPEFQRVTDEILRHPSPDDWLAWRGTGRSLGYSPLDQINRGNVSELQLAWSWSMEPGSQETAPLVYAGVMYLANPGGIVQALDAASGDLVWEYQPRTPTGGRMGAPVRNLAIADDKIFLNTADARLVALNARTGVVEWEVQVADPKLGFTFGAGSVIAHGKVISALSGCSRFVEEKCAIMAHDPQTGRELWRVHTIPKRGEPGDETWGDVEPMFRAGTDMWLAGSYDAELNLVFWSTSQAKPWAAAARGTKADALFSNTTFALDPDTGRIVWYRQLIPNESQDMDEVFENVLVDNGTRKSLFKMGKLGILWELDRQTGTFIHATDLGYQNIVSLDPRTGKVTYNEGKFPRLNEPVDMCPAVVGFKDWRAMAYSPETRAFYIPLSLNCGIETFFDVPKVAGRGGAGSYKHDEYILPQAGRNLGELLALSASGQVIWRQRQRAVFNSAALTTAGGLVFVGDVDRYFRAYDVMSGETLWQTRAPNMVMGFPISYAAHGEQYVAVPVGVGGASWNNWFPQKLTPEIRHPNTGNSLLVFRLPHKNQRP